MRAVVIQLLLAALLLPADVAADVFKWVDERGRVHYGDRPPPEASESRAVEIEPPPPVPADRARRADAQRRLLEAFEAERAEQDKARAEADAARADRERRCERTRRQLAAVARANLVYTRGEDGERIYMSDEERQRVVADAEAWMRKWCR